MVQKAKGRYRVQVRINGEIRGHVWTRREDAVNEERELVRERELMRAGLEMPQKKALVIDYAKTWLDRRKKNRPKSTWEKDETRLRLYILPEFGGRSIAHLQTKEWREFLDRLMEPKVGLSGATRNRVRALLHRLYREAIEDAICVQNPINAIPLLSEKKKTRPRLFWESRAEVERYLAAMAEEPAHYRLLALILLNTGMRIGEALGLQRQDIDLQGRLIHVRRIYDRATDAVVERTKAGEGYGRYAPMNGALYAALKALKPASVTAPVCSTGDGATLSPWSFRDAHDRAITRAKVKRIEVHQMRRTFASHFLMNGGSKEALREILGHSSQVVTEIYTDVAPDFLREQAQRVEFGMSRVRHIGTGRKQGRKS